MDEADQAQDNIERDLQLARQAMRRPALIPTGRCFNCDDIVADHMLFCEIACRDDFDHRQRLEKRPA